MTDLIERQAAIDAIAKFVPHAICDESTESYTNGLTDAFNLICQLPSAQPEQKIEELLPDGTLSLITDTDLSKVGRVFVSQNGTHYGILCYADGELKPSAQPELIRPKARDVYYEETDHCEFKCSLCHATIGVVEGGTLDGAWFRFCPNCGAEMEDWCERPD